MAKWYEIVMLGLAGSVIASMPFRVVIEYFYDVQDLSPDTIVGMFGVAIMALTLAILAFFHHREMRKIEHQIFTKQQKEYIESLRDNVISAARNAKFYNVDNGFTEVETNDGKFKVVIGWQIDYKSFRCSQSNEIVPSDNFVFCVFSRVFSISDDIDAVFGGKESPRILLSLFDWDYYAKLTCIDGEYSEGIVQCANGERKNTDDLVAMNDPDLYYALHAIATLHFYDWHEMERSKQDGEKYEVRYWFCH